MTRQQYIKHPRDQSKTNLDIKLHKLIDMWLDSYINLYPIWDPIQNYELVQRSLEILATIINTEKPKAALHLVKNNTSWPERAQLMYVYFYRLESFDSSKIYFANFRFSPLDVSTNSPNRWITLHCDFFFFYPWNWFLQIAHMTFTPNHAAL